jgi:hypothetical protein
MGQSGQGKRETDATQATSSLIYGLQEKVPSPYEASVTVRRVVMQHTSNFHIWYKTCLSPVYSQGSPPCCASVYPPVLP